MVLRVIPWLLPALVCVLAGPKPREPRLPEDNFGDDIKSEVEKLKARLQSEKENMKQKHGIVLFSYPPLDSLYAGLTVPLWEEYAQSHKHGFFLYNDTLLSDKHPWWTRTRVLIELMQAVKWKETLVVTTNSLPAGFQQPWHKVVKGYMRVKRYSNDDVASRLIWTPQDCDPEAERPWETGSCHGAFLDIMVLEKSKTTVQILKSWHAKRLMAEDFPDNPYKEAFEKTRLHYYSEVFYQATGTDADFGANYSKQIPYWEIGADRSAAEARDQIHLFIKNHKLLGPLSNKLVLEAERKAEKHREL